MITEAVGLPWVLGGVISLHSPENNRKDDLRHSSSKFLAASFPVPFSLADLLPSSSKTLLVGSHFSEDTSLPLIFPTSLACSQTLRFPLNGLGRYIHVSPGSSQQTLPKALNFSFQETLPSSWDAIQIYIGGTQR